MNNHNKINVLGYMALKTLEVPGLLTASFLAMKFRHTHLSATLLASALLLATPQNAGAKQITFSFTGLKPNSVQESELNGWCQDCASDMMTFTLDASRYTDGETTAGITEQTTIGSAAPWLASSSASNGLILSAMLTTAGNIYSYLFADTGSLLLLDHVFHVSAETYDAQGRISTQKGKYGWNFAQLSGVVSLGVIDGNELPVAISSIVGGQSFIEQYWYDLDVSYTYDNQGVQSATRVFSSGEYSNSPIGAASITLSNGNIPAVPEPEVWAMLLAGLIIIARRTK